jgi:branched-subunit amino acid ABC-type transport system permease component
VSALGSAAGYGLITASILAIAAVGFSLQFGVTNVLNLAYGEVMTAAAFAAYFVTNAGLGLWVGVIAGAAAGAVLSYVLNRFFYAQFARRGTKLFAMIMVTLAASLVLQNGMTAIFGAGFFSVPVRGSGSVSIGPATFTGVQLAILAIAVCAMVAVQLLLQRTRLGQAMRATATNPELARACGMTTSRVIDCAWLLSGALCGLAGVMLVMNLGTFTTGTGGTFLIPIIAAAILGGIGHASGAMLGALVIGLTTEISAVVIRPDYKNVVAFVVLILVLLLRPQGILADVATAKEVAA